MGQDGDVDYDDEYGSDGFESDTTSKLNDCREAETTFVPVKPKTKESQKDLTVEKLQIANEALQKQLRLYSDSLRTALNKTAAPKKPKYGSQSLRIKDKQLMALNKKVDSYKKMNSELKDKLSKLYSTELYSQLENSLQEKQRRIDELVKENRTLQKIQRSQERRLDEYEHGEESFPARLHSVMEELRIYKEKVRHIKATEQKTEARNVQIHQQIVDLSAKNTEQASKLQHFETLKIEDQQGKALTITSQHQEIEKMKAKIQSLEKLKRVEKIKYDKALREGQDEIHRCKEEMEMYQAKLLTKEKEIRSQVVQVKNLKRDLRDLVTNNDENHEIYSFLMRTTERFQGPKGVSPERKLPVYKTPRSSSLSPRKLQPSPPKSHRSFHLQSPKEKNQPQEKSTRATEDGTSEYGDDDFEDDN